MGMNTFIPFHSRWLLPVSMLISPFAIAIEPPADEAAPPQLSGEKAERTDAAVVEQIGFLGVVTGPIPELLSTHLGVRNGEGVLVRSVMPDGPAAQAGIAANDIIITIDGKSALSAEEVSKIVRSHKPGDRINIGLIQEGKGADLAVTLGKRPEEIAHNNRRPNIQLQQMEGMPEDMADRIREMIEGNMMQFRFNGEELKLGEEIPDIQEDMKQLREEMKELRMQNRLQLQGGDLNFNANTTVRLMDNEGSVELSSNNGESTLIVRDKENNIQWQGPWNNDEDKAKAPEDIRARAGNLNFDGNGLKFDLRGR